ncbi:MAG: glycosyltransferase family 39 protein [Patescibacteria group bacterium]
MNCLSLNTIIFKKYRTYLFILACFIAWLLVLYLTAFFTFDKNHYQATTPWFSPSYWARWDSKWYVDIASNGYTELTTVFFPGYPILIKAVSSLGLNPFWAGHLISCLFLYLALILLFELIKKDFSGKTGIFTVIFLLAFPFSFFLISVYPESLLLFLFAACFYLARQKKWLFASLLAGLAGTTKLAGLILFPLLIIEYLKSKNWQWREIKADALVLLIAPLGFISYLIYLQAKFGHWFYFIRSQQSFDTRILLPHETISRYFLRTFTEFIYRDWQLFLIFLINFLSIILILVLTPMVIRKLRVTYLILLAFILIYPLFGEIIHSFSRYLLPIFPFFLGLALIKNRLAKITLLLSFFILLIIFTSFFVNWQWVA